MWSESAWEGQRYCDLGIHVIERKYNSAWECIVDATQCSQLVYCKKGKKDIPVLTDYTTPLWMGPKELEDLKLYL